MKSLIVIPSRYESTRFPGKSLALIAGKSMISRVWEVACAVCHASEVYVATDDQRIFDHVVSFGGQAVLTPKTCKNGTERVYATLQLLHDTPDVVINFQGDAPLTPPWVIEELLIAMYDNPEVGIATLAIHMDSLHNICQYETLRRLNVSGTYVVFDKNYNALYFSKAFSYFLKHHLQKHFFSNKLFLYKYQLYLS